MARPVLGSLLDLAVVAVFVALAWWGARRGAGESGLRLAALFVAYGAAVLAATGLGAPAAQRLGLPATAGMLIAGTGAFLLAQLAVGRAAGAVGRAERRGTPDGRPGRGSRLLGGVFGGLRAAVLLLPLLWLAHLVQGLDAAGVAGALPDLSGARLPVLGGAAARVGAAVVVDETDPAQRMTARLLTEPGETVREAQELLEQPSLLGLRHDADFWAAVEDGEVQRALRRPSFTDAMDDAALRRQLAELGLLDRETAADPAAFRREMKTVLTEVGARLRALRDDPALRALMRDEELQRRIQDGDTLALLADPRFRDLMGRVAGGAPPTL